MNFSEICRLCLKSNNSTLLDMFNNYDVKTSYSEMLSTCTKIKPNQEDQLPKQICKDCCRQLKKVYIFNQQCEESDKQLRCYLDLLENPNSDVDLELPVTGVSNGETDVTQDEDNALLDVVKDELTDEKVKIEVNYNEYESFWDTDDDDIPENVKDRARESGIEKKKKRGRKKKDEQHSPSASKKPHQCDVCGKLLSTKSNLKAHKICHTDQRPYQCSDCPATFRGHSALFQHKKLHTGETPYHCEYCPKQFARRSGLVNHIRIHTGEKLYSCDVCSKNFVQGAQLSIHMRRHKGDKPFLCQDCGKGFPIKADLKVHQRIHNGEKPYSCHLCTKTFATSGNLSIHIRIHTREVRYNCPECHKGFVTCSAFNVHLKRHKGQRDYQCECGKTFYTSSALKQHKVVHTGEKKYQCKICERKFSQTSHLSRHFKRDHMKPNVPVPSSDYFKHVIREGEESVFNLLDSSIQKIRNDSDVKCENS
ncbi:zinc finger protein 501-like isoform X2 [Plodia interpunctella]|uniref:zinc finger protein 501-like isoform X2 n=1 Tax=Plodia interpunctella TaxID=58824 RepID=UPI002368769D|nr:zinc finger protein 501-like isoform X2 [Plodia interpunctella]